MWEVGFLYVNLYQFQADLLHSSPLYKSLHFVWAQLCVPLHKLLH